MPKFGWTTGEEGKTPLLDLKAGASLELSKDKRFVDYLEQQKTANQLNVPTAVVEAQPALAKSKLEQLEIEKNPALQQIAAQGPEYAALVRENKEEIVSVASYFEQEEQATPKRKKIYEVIAEAWELDEKEKENESTLLRAIKAPERFMSGVFNSIIMPELSLRAADYAIETSEKAMDAFNDAPGFLEGYEAAKKSLLLSRNENLEGMKNSLNFAWDEGKIQNRALEISSALLSGDFESADRVADEYRADFAEIEKNKKSGPNSEGLEWLAAPAITNFARDLENAPLMAGATVAGTLVGSGVGFGLARGKGAAQGAKLGTFIGYMSGQGAVSFQAEMGSFYADTASELDDRGEALPKDSVRAAAFLYASGATAIEMGADTYLAKALGLGKIADKAGLIVARKEFKEKLVDLAKSQKGQELLTNIAVKMAKGMTSEGLEEASQEALSMLISYELKEQLNVNGDNEFANNELFTRENLSQLENAFSTGARAFLGQGSAITLGSTILDARANAAILKFADKEQALSEAINDGAIKKLSPDHAEVAIEQLGAKGNIYIQAEDFIELKQSVALAEALGLDFKNIEQAVAKGHLLEIPRAKALVRLDKEQYAAIAPIMRYDTDALNAKEVQEIESNLGQVILEKAQIHEAATKDKELFEQALALHEENVIAAIDANPNLRMQAAAQAGGVEAYVSTYMKMLRGFSERMAYAGASLTSTLEKLIVNTELGKNIKQQDPVAVLQQHIANNSIPALTDADNIQLAFDEVLKSGVLSKEEATKALEVVSNPNLLEEYYLELEREAARAELGKQAKPEWLEYAWGRIDGKALKETWPDAYKEISRSVGVGVFRSAKRGGIAIDQLADEMVSEGLLPYDADSDDLVEMLKGYERQEFYQAVEQAGTESNAEIEKAAKLWREKGTESPYFKKWFGNSDHQGNSFFQGGYRGSMRTMADGQYLVKLFKKANLSTLLHETGHVFMAEMGMAVKNGVADQTMIDDYATLQSWLAQFDDLQAAEKQYNKYVKGSFNNRAFSELTPYEAKQAIEIVKQEYFARGFERYLAEGKAPSHDLQEVFRRFAAWLKAVYRTVAKLDVELNDEVRRVFDRMLNVDEEISQAAFANEVVAMTNEQIEALKLNKEDKAKLNELLERGKQAAINLMAEKRLSGNKERRRLWAEEAWAELLKQPVYKLRDEINKDGQALDGQALQYFIGEEGVKLLRRHLGPRAINMDGNGQVVEAVAVKYGYANISEMVKDLLESKPKGKAIKEIVETKQAEYDAQIKPEDFLLQTPELAERVEAVGKYIETALGIEGRTAVINYQAVAAEHLQSLSVSQASSQLQFIGALRRALKKERKAIVKDDFAEALKANRQARLNIELLKQSMAFKEQTKKDESRLKAFMKTKSADVDAKFVAMVIGAKHAMIKPDAKIVEGRSASTIEAWLKKTQDAGYDLLINPELFMKDSLTPWRGMPVSEYEELISALTQIRIAEKSMREVELNGKKVALAEAVKALTGTIYEHREGKELKGFEKDNFIVEGLKLVHAAHTKIEALCKTLDGGKNLGAVWNAIYKPINDAENKRVLMRKGLEKKLEPVFGLYKPQEWGKMYKDKIAIGGLVGERMAKAEIMAIALNVGNEGNYARLMEGHDLNETKLAYLLAELDERDWHFVQGVWNAFESFKQEAFDLEQKMTGIRPVEVQAKPVVTKYGVLRGGYYPVMYDLKKLPIDSEEKIIGGNNPAATMTRHGHLKERAKHGIGTALKLDIGLIPKALNQVMTDICLREAVLDVAKVLRNKEFRTAIETTVGHEQYQSLVTWLRDVANEDKHEFAPLENFFGWARSSATIMAMGFKATTAIAQPFGITQSIQVIGLDAVRKGLKDAFGNPKLTIQKSAWIKSKSAFMADRLNAFDRDIFDSTKWSAQQALTPSSALDAITPDFIQRGEQFLKKHAFILTSLTQYGVDMPTWLGAYSKGLKDFNGDDAKAVDYADSAVRLSQGSGYTKDLARIQRGANAYKMFTMFYSYFSTVYNLTANVAADVNIKRDWQSVIKAGNAFVLLYILPSILSELAVGRGPDEDEEPLPWAVQQVLMYPMQTIVGVRTFAGVVEAEFGYKLTPAQDAPASLYNLFKELNKLAFDEDKEFDGKEFFKLAVKTYGFAKGLPLMQPVITAYSIWDYVDGTAYDFEARDLIFTKPKSRR